MVVVFYAEKSRDAVTGSPRNGVCGIALGPAVGFLFLIWVRAPVPTWTRRDPGKAIMYETREARWHQEPGIQIPGFRGKELPQSIWGGGSEDHDEIRWRLGSDTVIGLYRCRLGRWDYVWTFNIPIFQSPSLHQARRVRSRYVVDISVRSPCFTDV